MQKQMAEYMDGDYYAIPISDTEYLIVPKAEQDTVVYLQSVLSRLGNSVLASAELRNRAAYEYDSGSNRMKPFDHTRILQGLSAVGEEIPGYHVNQREPTEKEIKKSNRTH